MSSADCTTTAAPDSSAIRSSSSVSSSVRTQPTSMALSLPVRAVLTISRGSLMESSRLRASRLPVPSGRSAIGTPVPASVSATARTVPSPPAATTTLAPASSACRACPAPGSSIVVSRKMGSGRPTSRAVCAIRRFRSTQSTFLDGLRTTTGGPTGDGSGASSSCRWAGEAGEESIVGVREARASATLARVSATIATSSARRTRTVRAVGLTCSNLLPGPAGHVGHPPGGCALPATACPGPPRRPPGHRPPGTCTPAVPQVCEQLLADAHVSAHGWVGGRGGRVAVLSGRQCGRGGWGCSGARVVVLSTALWMTIPVLASHAACSSHEG